VTPKPCNDATDQGLLSVGYDWGRDDDQQDQRRRDGAAGNALVGASQITLVPALT
jgi:hypothetical protein